MNPREAMEAALEWSRSYGYRADADGVDYWETAQEMAKQMGADCDGHAVACLQRFAEHCDRPLPPVRLVVGDAMSGRHAWVEIEVDGNTLWCDPTPGWANGLHRPTFWARTPRFAYQFDGECFGARGEYARVP